MQTPPEIHAPTIITTCAR